MKRGRSNPHPVPRPSRHPTPLSSHGSHLIKYFSIFCSCEEKTKTVAPASRFFSSPPWNFDSDPQAKTRSITGLAGHYDWAPLRPGGEAHDEVPFTPVSTMASRPEWDTRSFTWWSVWLEVSDTLVQTWLSLELRHKIMKLKEKSDQKTQYCI